jgi:hypothetical protein
MKGKTQILPRIAIQSIGGGLLLMALFTMMWTGVAQGGLNGQDHHIILIIFSLVSLLFVSSGIIIIIAAKKFPKYISEDDQTEGKSMMKSFGIIFGIEGTAIPVAYLILAMISETRLILPVIALIVGLHFYPMAKIFQRTVDYYLATWTCVVAVVSILIIIKYDYPQQLTLTYLGIGVALATTTYGLYMLYQGYNLIKSLKEALILNK